MIYLDTSVALAQLLTEDTVYRPESDGMKYSSAVGCWSTSSGTSSVLNGWGESHGEPARELTQRLAILQMVPSALARALEPFLLPLRTLDTLHLASLEFLNTQGQSVVLASYDAHRVTAARKMGIPVFSQ